MITYTDLFRKQFRQFLLIEFGSDHADFAGKLCLSLTDINLAGHIVKIGPLTCAVRQHAFGAEHKAVNVFLLQRFKTGSDLILHIGGCRLASPAGKDLVRMVMMLMLMIMASAGTSFSVIMMMPVPMLFVVMIVMMVLMLVLLMVVVVMMMLVIMLLMVVVMMMMVMAATGAVLIMFLLDLCKKLSLKIPLLLHGA